ncbi:MAG TPA: TA system VapC family ribonuclease toxin [Acidobacteriaceae bacterium]|nr:TA system VapC family ribonuclease toxin [Acidobacteriaceae bacterium]
MSDVNVWIALTSDQHVHHRAAKRWIEKLEADKLAFCRITELGFLRLLTNRHVMGNGTLTPAQAWNIYDALRADPRVVFSPEPPAFSGHWREAGNLISGGPNAWTDAYLAAFASCEQMTVATFDRRFKAINQCSILTLIPDR